MRESELVHDDIRMRRRVTSLVVCALEEETSMVRGVPSRPVVLPVPNADVWDWQLRGLCRGYDSSVFYHPDGERGRARILRERKAKDVCAKCPVLLQCRTHALEVNEPYGVWGGMSAHDRADHNRIAAR